MNQEQSLKDLCRIRREELHMSAQRLSELTDIPISTINKFLQMPAKPRQFTRLARSAGCWELISITILLSSCRTVRRIRPPLRWSGQKRKSMSG